MYDPTLPPIEQGLPGVNDEIKRIFVKNEERSLPVEEK